ncbi:MAG: twin-arginine translocase subunit TatC [candidate division Zixibacteria bacterium]|nr:twin-arginine translocase subunit TatC [candidate division Zixibacteria bacterium]
MAKKPAIVGEMSFLDHLEELRWAILKSVLAILFGMIACFFFADEILKFLVSPTRLENLNIRLIFLKPAGMFMVKINLSLACGFAVAMPVVLYQLWRFVSPGLLAQEKKYIPYVIFFSTLLFVLGAAFAFYALIPAMVQFFVVVGIEGVTAEWDIGEYMSLVMKMVITMGLVFEMPLLIAFLTWIRLLSSGFLKRNWRMAIVVSFIVSAVITPTIDPYTQVLVALPLVLLYFLSLGIAILIDRRDEEPESSDPVPAEPAPETATYPRGLYNFTGPESGMSQWPPRQDEYIFEYEPEDPGHAGNRIETEKKPDGDAGAVTDTGETTQNVDNENTAQNAPPSDNTGEEDRKENPSSEKAAPG